MIHKEIVFYDSTVVDGVRYFSAAFFNGLFKILEGYHIQFIGFFPGRDVYCSNMHRNVFVNGKKLIFTPFSGSKIDIYDTETSEFSNIELADSLRDFCFSQSLQIGRDILMIPKFHNTPFILFGMDSGTSRWLTEINSYLSEKNISNKGELFSVYSADMIGNDIYIALYDTNILLKVKHDVWDVEMIKSEYNCHFRNLSIIKGKIVITLKEHALISHSIEKGESNLIYVPDDNMNNNYPYLKAINIGDDVVLISGKEDDTWITDIEFSSWEKVKFSEAPERFSEGTLQFFSFEYRDEVLFLFPRSIAGIIEYNVGRRSTHFYSLVLAQNSIDEIERCWMRKLIHDTQIINEGTITLRDFLQGVSSI